MLRLVLLSGILFFLPIAASPLRAQVPPAETAQLEEQLARQFGPDFLPALREMGKTVQDYTYAARLVQVAIQKIHEQDYQDARFLLEKAHSVIPSPHILYWLGKTHQGLVDLVHARRHYLRFIDEAGRWRLTPVKQEFLDAARAELERIDRQLCWLRLQVSQDDAKVYVDGEFVGKSPIQEPLPLRPGPHSVVVIKPGFVRRDLDVVLTEPGKETQHTVTLLTEAESIRQSQLFREAEMRRLETQRRLEETRRRMEREDRRRRQAYAAWSRGLLLGGAAAGVLTAGFGVLSWHYQQRVDDAAPDTPWKSVADDQERARFLRISAYVGLSLTITAVGISTWLTQLSAAPARKTWTAAPWLTPESAGLALGWTF